MTLGKLRVSSCRHESARKYWDEDMEGVRVLVGKGCGMIPVAIGVTV